MIVLLPLVVFIFLHLLFRWMRKGNGGVVGKKVRDSDHWAWQYAMEEKERELDELRKIEPPR